MADSVIEPRAICIVGAGYIGYPLALLLAEAGYDVLATDVNEEVVFDINSGVPRSDESDVVDLAKTPDIQGRLRASVSPEEADVFIVTVPTPLDDTGRRADLGYVERAVRSLSEVLRPGNLVIVESTVPPGTTTGLVTDLLEETGLLVGDDVYLAHCPERLHPGSTLSELRGNDRLIGGVDAISTQAARRIYEKFVTGDLVDVDPATAELCKLFENTFRDVNLALTNSMAAIAEDVGVDAGVALELASLHPRVSFLNPGIGVGGHCIPVDPWFLHQVAPELAGLIEAARKANLAREDAVIDRIVNAVEGIEKAVVVVAGVAFKPDVADTRESPAMRIAGALGDRGLEVRIFDPVARPEDTDLMAVADGADLLVVAVPHVKMTQTIGALRFDLEAVMRRPMVVDVSSGAIKPFIT